MREERRIKKGAERWEESRRELCCDARACGRDRHEDNTRLHSRRTCASFSSAGNLGRSA